MNWIITKFKWIMLVSGALTCTMIYAVIDPQASLRSNFGTTLEGPLADIVVRNWGALIVLVGVMLIRGAYDPPVRPLVLTFAGVSKLIFISLVLCYGQPFLGHQIGVAVVVDSIMIALFLVYLVGMPRASKAG